MNRPAQKQIQGLQDTPQLQNFANQLHKLLLDELNDGQPLSDNRARAVMLAMGVLDEATYNAFSRLVESEANLRVALYELLTKGEIALEMPAPLYGEAKPVQWHTFLLAVHAFKTGYPLHQLDPSSPPSVHTPAGMVVQQAAQFMRIQIQRSATERDRLARQLAYNAAAAGTPSLDQLSNNQNTIAPVPPYFRSPVPVRYPEYNPQMRLEDDESADAPAVSPSDEIGAIPSTSTPSHNVQRGTPIKITRDEIEPPLPPAQRMPQIRITREQVTPPSPQIRTGRPVQLPRPNPRATPSAFAQALTNMFKTEEMKTTRLRVVVQEYPDGPGVFGLQVQVTCKGVKSYVAGTTDRNGRFVCELPVRLSSGLTYDVDVTWPREEGGANERKSITLNADRTEFNLPFYRRLHE